VSLKNDVRQRPSLVAVLTIIAFADREAREIVVRSTVCFVESRSQLRVPLLRLSEYSRLASIVLNWPYSALTCEKSDGDVLAVI